MLEGGRRKLCSSAGAWRGVEWWWAEAPLRFEFQAGWWWMDRGSRKNPLHLTLEQGRGVAGVEKVADGQQTPPSRVREREG